MRIAAAFESWYTGTKLNISPLFLESTHGREILNRVIEDDSNTVATLHVYPSEAVAKAAYSKLKYVVRTQKLTR
jgi:hypothetical protein